MIPMRPTPTSALSTGILLLFLTTTPAFAGTVTIGFDGLTGKGAFTSYTQDGFTVSSSSGDWLISQTFGDPAPYIYFLSPAGSTTTASIDVTEGGSNFTFSSIDLYSSTTKIPYTFAGLLNGSTVFTVTGVVPNTFGNFALVTNPDATLDINELEVTLEDPCCSNPVGLDNLAVVTTTSTTPEPASLALVLAGLAALGFLWPRTRISGAKGA